MADPGSPGGPPHRRRANIPRAPIAVAAVVVVAAGLLFGGRSSAGRAAAQVTPTGPVAAPDGALSSSWFCAGATGDAAGAAPGRVVIADSGPTSLSAAVDIVGSNGAHRTIGATVPAGGRISVAESLAHGAPWVAATVVLDGGGASVEEQVAGPLGFAAVPCATSGSTNWYFDNGATLVNSDTEISLLNPYPSAAIVDLTFATDEGTEQPGAFQALVVPSHTLLAVDLRRQLRRRSFIATSVQATSGRVVAWKTDVVTTPRPDAPIIGTKAATRPFADPASPHTGITLALGTPAPSTTWDFPQGLVDRGVTDRYVLYNPGSRSAQVAIAVHLDAGTAEPFALTVAAGQVATLDMATEARIPDGDAYSVEVRSTNGVPVVAERTVTEASPAAVSGIAEMFGASAPSGAWLVGAGAVTPDLDELLDVSDPGSAPAVVTVSALSPTGRQVLPGLAHLRIDAGGHVVIDLGRLVHQLGAALVVRATSPVVVERDLVGRRDHPGLGLSLGVPLAGGSG